MNQPLSRDFLLQRGYCCHLGCQNCPYTPMIENYPYTPMIENYLRDLKETWDFTTETINDIKSQMAAYAMDAVMDSAVREEAEKITQLDNLFDKAMNKFANTIEEDLERKKSE